MPGRYHFDFAVNFNYLRFEESLFLFYSNPVPWESEWVSDRTNKRRVKPLICTDTNHSTIDQCPCAVQTQVRCIQFSIPKDFPGTACHCSSTLQRDFIWLWPITPVDSFKKHGRLPAHDAQCSQSKRRPTGLPLFELSQITEEDLPPISWDLSIENLINVDDVSVPLTECDLKVNKYWIPALSVCLRNHPQWPLDWISDYYYLTRWQGFHFFICHARPFWRKSTKDTWYRHRQGIERVSWLFLLFHRIAPRRLLFD